MIGDTATTVQHTAQGFPSLRFLDPHASQHRGRPLPADENLGNQDVLSSEEASPKAAGKAHRALRKLSPGLLARMKLLDAQNKTRSTPTPATEQEKVGRIPQSQLRDLEKQYRHPEAGLRQDKPSQQTLMAAGPTHSDNSFSSSVLEALGIDSDHSSIISTSDKPAPSDNGSNDGMDMGAADTQKYRLPDIGKIRMSSVTAGHDTAAQDSSLDRSPAFMPKEQDDASKEWQQSGDFDNESLFRNHSASRANSIYSLSRASFTNQLSQLTSISLPQASTLASNIAAIPTSTGAARTLSDAAGQIRRWIQKASQVLTGLDAEDDVEWAAAGGRDGLGEVDAAITRFESLIDIYVTAIDELQMRKDISSLHPQELQRGVEQMESILKDWNQIKNTLQGVKEQVEIAMEWEELWNSVFGDIGNEMDALTTMVFEMEERRHRNNAVENPGATGVGFDILELETIVEEAPSAGGKPAQQNRLSIPANFGSVSPSLSPQTQNAPEESNLLGLFARMQPLRASLDFLPMRLSVFRSRASPIFPTACEELEKRHESLEEQWTKLEADAESLRRELGEDRWILVFRNAGRQALKMCESVTRSIMKLAETFEDKAHHTHGSATMKKVESYEAKKMHYGPAIERVISIIDKGVKDRLTVNGEILRLQSDVKQRWVALQSEMQEIDATMEDLNINKSQQLRDSISTILSVDRSVTSSIIDTPCSSPASSVIMSRKNSEQGSSPPLGGSNSRPMSLTDASGSDPKPSRRYSGIPSRPGSLSSGIPRMSPNTRSLSEAPGRVASSPTASRTDTSTPKPSRVQRLSMHSAERPNKPRWNSSTNLSGTAIGHNFKSDPTTTPSPHRNGTMSGRTSSAGNYSGIPIPSPLSRSSAFSPPPPHSPSPSVSSSSHSPALLLKPATQRHASSPSTTTLQAQQKGAGAGPTPPLLRNKTSTPYLPGSTYSDRRKSNLLSEPSHYKVQSTETPTKPSRPPSALASGGRHSLLPQSKTRSVSTTSVLKEDRPRWR